MRPIVWKVGGAALLALVLVLAFVLTRSDPVEDAPALAAPGAIEETLALSGSRAPLATRDALADATLPSTAAIEIELEPATAVAADVRTVRGRVLDVEGRAVPDVVLLFGDVEVAADARGEFTVDPALLTGGRLAVRSDEHVLVSSGRRAEDGGRALIVVVARTARLFGTVVHEDGTPAPGIEVKFQTALDALASFPLVLEHASWWGGNLWTTSAADGGFSFERAPRVTGALEAGSYDTLHGTRHVAPSDEPVTLVLRPISRPALTVSGIVVDAAGARVARASVNLGPAKTESAEDGTFTLELTHVYIAPGKPIPQHVAGFSLAAVLEGAGPAVIVGFGARLADPAACRDVVLRLGERPLAIEGRVVHADGTPAAGWRVALRDATPLGYTTQTVETIRPPYHLRTDADGRFRHAGLLDRSYCVCAVDEATALFVDSGPVPAGTSDLVLRVAPDPWRTVRGVVRSRSGDAVPNASVRTHHRVSDRTDGLIESVSGEPVAADSEGRFEIARCPRQNAALAVSGNGIGGTVVEIPDGDLARPVEIVVPLLLRFRLELAPGGADEFAVVGSDDEVQRLTWLRPGGGTSLFDRFKVSETLATRVFEVAESATSIVLYRDGTEVRRIPLDLVPGEVTTVRG